MKKMTVKSATEIAQRAQASHARRGPGDKLDHTIRESLDGSGWTIPFGAFTDGDDARTATNLAAWIRRYAVSDKALGRPVEIEGGKRVNVYLDPASLARAAELGGGNVSEGIRLALAK